MTEVIDQAISDINNAAQIAQGIDECVVDPGVGGRRIVALLAGARATMLQLLLVNVALQEDLRGLRDEGLAMAQEVTEARQMRADVVALLEEAKRCAFRRLDSASAEFNALTALYSKLVPPAERSYPRPMGAPQTIDEPRAIAVGV